ncbi:hypothetical protein L1987_35683 [Smallanthus sonchifolius]|uniref:Uncharacterized protein n=1 Tax=Smallanthus sonchifolius TaxID=185202 RepID=A0ACB9HD29_9ASTR|nr:hypothetical protein L1987_35683 [Smallanthus sonchifolius]
MSIQYRLLLRLLPATRNIGRSPNRKPKQKIICSKMANLLRCQRIGCNATFTEDDNPEDSCTYHESVSFLLPFAFFAKSSTVFASVTS